MSLRWTIHAVLLIALTSAGCADLQMAWMVVPAYVGEVLSREYKDVEFRVIDGETLAPIAGATLSTSRDTGWGGSVDLDRGVTDSSGRVRLRMEVRKLAGSTRVDAPGYIPEHVRMWSGLVDGKREPVLALYRLPAAFTGLEVPRGYRGFLRITEAWDGKHTTPPAPWPKGQRAFLTRANLTGETVIQPALLWREGGQASARIWVAQFDDGTPLPLGWNDRLFDVYRESNLANLVPSDARLVKESVLRDPNGVALWALFPADVKEYISYGQTTYYFVGTYAELKAALAKNSKLRLPLPPPPGSRRPEFIFN